MPAWSPVALLALVVAGWGDEVPWPAGTGAEPPEASSGDALLRPAQVLPPRSALPPPPGGVGSTPGALAVALVDHLEPHRVTGVGGSGEGAHLAVSVEVEAPGLDAVSVSVTGDRAFAIRECGGDAGYRTLECSTSAAIRELLVQERRSCPGAVLVGRYDDDRRGHVLVQVFGADSAANRQLVADLLDDPLVGATTFPLVRERGEGLALDPSVQRLEVATGRADDGC